MTNHTARVLAALLALPACIDADRDSAIGRLDWGTPTAGSPATADLVTCPSPYSGPALVDNLCGRGERGCEQLLQSASDGTEWSAVGPGLYVDRTGEVPEWNACDHLPADGPCALACDPAALGDWVPAGACVVLVCPLDDGGTLVGHVCGV